MLDCFFWKRPGRDYRFRETERELIVRHHPLQRCNRCLIYDFRWMLIKPKR